jgi:hypothetical protein
MEPLPGGIQEVFAFDEGGLYARTPSWKIKIIRNRQLMVAIPTDYHCGHLYLSLEALENIVEQMTQKLSPLSTALWGKDKEKTGELGPATLIHSPPRLPADEQIELYEQVKDWNIYLNLTHKGIYIVARDYDVAHLAFNLGALKRIVGRLRA